MSTINRRTFIKHIGLGAAAAKTFGILDAVTLAAENTPQTKTKPNIIVIMADDLGWGDLSCYPQDPRFPDARLRTPNIDSLATEGVRCTQGYATCCVCAPTRAGLLTGRYQQRFGYYAFEECLAGLPADEMTLAECLKQKGYATALIGKWHVGYKLSPLTRGFDRFYGFRGGQHDFFDSRLGDPTHGFSFDYYDAEILDQDKPVEKMDYLTDELTQQSIRFIDEQARAKTPFFLYLAHATPHPPMQATWEKLKPFAEARGGKFNVRDLARAMLVSLDDGVGQILDRLMHLGIDDNTLIVFTSDNGGADDSAEYNDQSRMTQHNGGLRARKGFFWEGGIRVPFIVRWPGHVPEGQVYHHPVTHLDIYATAVAAADAPLPPKPLDGVNLVAYLNGQKTERPHETLYWGFQDAHKRWAIRHGDWKLTLELKDNQSILEKKYNSVLELHNLADDPLEQNDLQAERPDKVKELMAIRNAFYKTLPPSICTPAMLEDWKKDCAMRRARLKEKHNVEDESLLRRDGHPGQWNK